MPTITIREKLDRTAAVAPNLETSVSPSSESSITRLVTFAKCSRCDFEWLPRVQNPVKCPHCKTDLWNVPRAQNLPGKPAPTRKGKARGKSFNSDYNPRRSSKKTLQLNSADSILRDDANKSGNLGL